MINSALYSSRNGDWETPEYIFIPLDDEFHFTLDVCANKENSKCSKFFIKEQDGVSQDWGQNICWMNPPYGKEIARWMRKAYEASLCGATVICLVPARTDTRWFHDWVLGKAEIRFIKGRIKFLGAKSSAPFPSLIVIYRPEEEEK